MSSNGTASGPAGGAFEGFAVDAAGTRVRDDAFRVARSPDGGFALGVAVAWIDDLAPLGSDADLSGRRNGTGVGDRKGRLARWLSLDSTVAREGGRALVMRLATDARGRVGSFRAEVTAVGTVTPLDPDAFAVARRTGTDPRSAALAAASDLAATTMPGKPRPWRVPDPFEVVGALNRLANEAATRAMLADGRSLLLVGRAGPTHAATPEAAGTPKNPYGRFTSPIWRYADGVNGRLLADMAAGRPPRLSLPELADLAAELSRREARGAAAAAG